MTDKLEKIRKCRRCVDAGFDAVRPPPVFNGDLDAPLLIIGQAPGLTEHEQQSPFVGLSGNRLFSWLHQTELEESWIKELALIFRVGHLFFIVEVCGMLFLCYGFFLLSKSYRITRLHKLFYTLYFLNYSHVILSPTDNIQTLDLIECCNPIHWGRGTLNTIDEFFTDLPKISIVSGAQL